MTDAGIPPISDAFAVVYKTTPNGVGTGYGRVNIIGEHTDYNDGFVMPCILNHRTDVAVSSRTDRQLRGESTSFGQASMQMDAVPRGHWLAYVTGAISVTSELSLIHI